MSGRRAQAKRRRGKRSLGREAWRGVLTMRAIKTMRDIKIRHSTRPLRASGRATTFAPAASASLATGPPVSMRTTVAASPFSVTAMNDRSLVLCLHWGIRLCFGLTLALSLSVALAQETSTRFRCTLVDGDVHLLVEDPRLRHPDLVQDCATVQVAVAPLRPGAEEQAPPWVGFSGRIIRAPGMPGSAATLGAAERAADDGASSTALAALPAALAPLVQSASQRHQLDPTLVAALMYVESRYRPDARSPKGALGLMQLMPATAARYGVRSAADLLDPRTNIDIGVRHLRTLHDRYDGRLALMLAAYNAGEGAVERYGQRVPPFAETEAYVRRITALVGVPESALTP